MLLPPLLNILLHKAMTACESLFFQFNAPAQHQWENIMRIKSIGCRTEIWILALPLPKYLN